MKPDTSDPDAALVAALGAVNPSVSTPFQPYTLRGPEGDAIPLVCDSPHSGTLYPADFGHVLPFETLRRGEDTDIHVLWQALPSVGATLLAAQFPRAYIDPNRDLEDLDAELLAEPWPTPLQPSEKTRLGIGLIWRYGGKRTNADGRKHAQPPIYDRKLSVAEVKNRIDTYHRPYHAAMHEQIEAAHARFGAVWHLNLHSMPADSYAGLGIHSPHPLADFVLGDRDGSTAAPEFTATVADALRGRGFRVAINDPFKGVALIARIGRPAERRHSLQIEIHRGLYMDEATRERSAGFGALQQALAGVSQDIAGYVRQQVG